MQDSLLSLPQSLASLHFLRFNVGVTSSSDAAREHLIEDEDRIAPTQLYASISVPFLFVSPLTSSGNIHYSLECFRSPLTYLLHRESRLAFVPEKPFESRDRRTIVVGIVIAVTVTGNARSYRVTSVRTSHTEDFWAPLASVDVVEVETGSTCRRIIRTDVGREIVNCEQCKTLLSSVRTIHTFDVVC